MFLAIDKCISKKWQEGKRLDYLLEAASNFFIQLSTLAKRGAAISSKSALLNIDNKVKFNQSRAVYKSVNQFFKTDITS